MPDTIRLIGRSPACCVSVRTSHINRGASAFFTIRLSCGNCGADLAGALINLEMVEAGESQLLRDITLVFVEIECTLANSSSLSSVISNKQ